MPMTYAEQAALDAQRHIKFTDLPAEEQALRESLWGQIPAHLQAKARKMAGR